MNMIIIILILILIGIIGWIMWDKHNEKFGILPSMTYKIQNIVKDKNGVFYSTPGFDNFISPRFDPQNTRKNIQNPSQLPGNKFSATPATPLGYEEQCSSCESDLGIGAKNSGDNGDVVIDRLIFANRNSQLRGAGDPIRGDLPIVPNPPGWFTPSVEPQIDLQPGAMNMLAGDNDSTRKMASLFTESKTNLYSGANPNFTDRMYVQLGNRGADISVEAYP